MPTARRRTALDDFFALTLFEHPPVYVIGAGSPLEQGLKHVKALTAGRPCRVLARAMWHAPVLIPDLVRAARELADEGSGVALTVLAATAAECGHLRQAGLDALQVSSSAFVDERLYYPMVGTPKLYAAVHNAQTRSFKRHELAYAVRRLALITYDEQGDQQAVAELVGRYQDLAWVNHHPLHGHWRISPHGVRTVVSRSRCGLILSEMEGGNFASTEYLLCGVPVVSTPSQGGREEMFDPRHVTIVPPDPAAIMKAVQAYGSAAPDPLEVRRGVLERMSVHRWRLVDWLSSAIGSDLRPLADATGWLPQFRNKLRTRAEPSPSYGASGRGASA